MVDSLAGRFHALTMPALDLLLDPALAATWRSSGLKPLVLGGRELLPVVQGGMGVVISAHRLAGSVAAQRCWRLCETPHFRPPYQ